MGDGSTSVTNTACRYDKGDWSDCKENTNIRASEHICLDPKSDSTCRPTRLLPMKRKRVGSKKCRRLLETELPPDLSHLNSFQLDCSRCSYPSPPYPSLKVPVHLPPQHELFSPMSEQQMIHPQLPQMDSMVNQEPSLSKDKQPSPHPTLNEPMLVTDFMTQTEMTQNNLASSPSVNKSEPALQNGIDPPAVDAHSDCNVLFGVLIRERVQMDRRLKIVEQRLETLVDSHQTLVDSHQTLSENHRTLSVSHVGLKAQVGELDKKVRLHQERLNWLVGKLVQR